MTLNLYSYAVITHPNATPKDERTIGKWNGVTDKMYLFNMIIPAAEAK